MRIKIKPLSVNEAFQGRRYKTPKHQAYRDSLQYLLKPTVIPEGDLFLIVEFGLSNMQADVDNHLKCFVDALQDKYGFNDKRIVAILSSKTKTAKGNEFIEWEIKNTKGDK